MPSKWPIWILLGSVGLTSALGISLAEAEDLPPKPPNENILRDSKIINILKAECHQLEYTISVDDLRDRNYSKALFGNTNDNGRFDEFLSALIECTEIAQTEKSENHGNILLYTVGAASSRAYALSREDPPDLGNCTMRDITRLDRIRLYNALEWIYYPPSNTETLNCHYLDTVAASYCRSDACGADPLHSAAIFTFMLTNLFYRSGYDFSKDSHCWTEPIHPNHMELDISNGTNPMNSVIDWLSGDFDLCPPENHRWEVEGHRETAGLDGERLAVRPPWRRPRPRPTRRPLPPRRPPPPRPPARRPPPRPTRRPPAPPPRLPTRRPPPPAHRPPPRPTQKPPTRRPPPPPPRRPPPPTRRPVTVRPTPKPTPKHQPNAAPRTPPRAPTPQPTPKATRKWSKFPTRKPKPATTTATTQTTPNTTLTSTTAITTTLPNNGTDFDPNNGTAIDPNLQNNGTEPNLQKNGTELETAEFEVGDIPKDASREQYIGYWAEVRRLFQITFDDLHKNDGNKKWALGSPPKWAFPLPPMPSNGN